MQAIKISREEAKEQIRAVGLRATLPRIAVLHALCTAQRPLSHSDVVDRLKGESLDPATVYRNLIKLVEHGLARVASRVTGVIRYEATRGNRCNQDHPHFSCRVCGMVQCLPNTKILGEVNPRWESSLRSHELQIIGECPQCRAARERGEAPESSNQAS